mmetsp:Transcript_26057/g.38527  ORF Transcript_26057/g.38527 Transcript_26057/m.38527 type:complete len:337 (-) Transcript_26057:223-1233(-)
MISLVGGKIVIAISLFMVGLASVLAPLFVVESNEGFFSVGNMFASGILLGAGLTHQLPESAKILNADSLFPWAEFVAGITFITILIWEEILHLWLASTELHKVGNHHEENRIHHHGEKEHMIPENQPLSQSFYCSTHNGCSSNQQSNMITFLPPSTENIHHDHHHHEHHIFQHLHGSLLASGVLLSALSIHSLLEGLAIGISSDESSMISIMSAILAHKAFAAYALGSSMVASEVKRSHFVVLGNIFAISSPLGIIIGILLLEGSRDSAEGGIFTAVIKSMVAGTFLFISIIELANKELQACRQPHSVGGNKWLEVSKLAALLVGFFLMSSLALFF